MTKMCDKEIKMNRMKNRVNDLIDKVGIENIDEEKIKDFAIDKEAFMLGSLLHDVGKGITTKKKVYYLGYTKNKEEFFEEVMNKAYQKNNNLLIGFTGENQKKYKEYFKK